MCVFQLQYVYEHKHTIQFMQTREGDLHKNHLLLKLVWGLDWNFIQLKISITSIDPPKMSLLYFGFWMAWTSKKS